MATPASTRVRRVLKLVDELELDAEERRALRAELDAREACEIDLDACADDQERALARAIKQRIDAAARGETQSLSMPQFWSAVDARRQARRRPSAR
jgi:hypothetical protein